MQLWEGGVRMKSRDVRNGTKQGDANVSPGLRVLRKLGRHIPNLRGTQL